MYEGKPGIPPSFKVYGFPQNNRINQYAWNFGGYGAYYCDYVNVIPGNTYTVSVAAGATYFPSTTDTSKYINNGYVLIAFGGDI